MYSQKAFDVNNHELIYDFIERTAFGDLISNDGRRFVSTPMPFLLSENKQQLFGHMALANPQHKSSDGQEVLVSLLGPHAYVSPSWYNKPGVPTWNYQAAHIYGKCQIFRGEEKLEWLVEAMTNKYENTMPEPWQPNYNIGLLKAIVGIEITIDDIQCKFKLSQNRSPSEQHYIADQMEAQGAHAMANAMKALQE